MPARPPVATYRLQLNASFGFGLVPYLARLGVSDCYCSPVLAASPGSTHGTAFYRYTPLLSLNDVGGERVLDVASSEDVLALMAGVGPRDDEARFEPELVVVAERARARVGAWYELFVRSQTPDPARSGTFRDAELRLDEIVDGNIKDFITRVNQARRENPALPLFADLTFLEIDDDQLIAYVKSTPDKSNSVIVVVNLDPFAAHEATLRMPLDEIGVDPGGSYDVRDLLNGQRYTWSERNYVRVDPVAADPVHIFRVERASSGEAAR